MNVNLWALLNDKCRCLREIWSVSASDQKIFDQSWRVPASGWSPLGTASHWATNSLVAESCSSWTSRPIENRGSSGAKCIMAMTGWVRLIKEEKTYGLNLKITQCGMVKRRSYGSNLHSVFVLFCLRPSVSFTHNRSFDLFQEK